MVDSTATLPLRGAEPLEIRHSLQGSRLDLSLLHSAGARRITIDVGPSASIGAWQLDTAGVRHEHRSRAAWSIGSRSGWTWLFEDLASFGERVLVGERPSIADRNAAFAARCHIRSLARSLHARLDADALRIAQPFRPSYRFWVYAAVRNDPSGRVAQLAHVCPGLLVLAIEFDGSFAYAGLDVHRDASRSILAAVRAGEPIAQILDAASRSWAHRPWPDPDDPRVAMLAGATPAALEEALARQRLLLRRAGPFVRCADLSRPALPSFDAADIPREPLPNAAWFRVCSFGALALWSVGDTGLRNLVSRFVSRNAHRIDGWIRRHWVLAFELNEEEVKVLTERLVAYSEATGRRPTASCNPLRFLDDAERWYHRNSAAGRLGALLDRVPGLGLGPVTAVRTLADGVDLSGRANGVPLPAVPLALTDPGLAVEPIRTPLDLAAEGREMSHCVATLLPEVLSGRLFVYRVRVRGQRLTLAVRVGDGEFEIAELRGRDNRDPTRDEYLRMSRWVGLLDRPTSG